MKQKKCKSCGNQYEPKTTFQKACSPKCAISFVKEEKTRKSAREWRKEKKKRLDKLKTRSDWLREAQQAFNRFIRARDRDESCISCNRLTGAKMNAGHYLTVGAHPELRFEELNCHIQCEHCNSYLSGNQIRYRKNLIKKIGLDKVEWLEGPHEPKKYTIEEIKEIKAKYLKLAKELESI